jgi:hypothetical protein
MVGSQNDVFNAHVKKYSNPSPQVVQDSIHLSASLGDIVLLTEPINLLRCHKDQLCVFDALANLLCGLGQKIVQLGIKNINTCMMLQRPKTRKLLLSMPNLMVLSFQVLK